MEENSLVIIISQSRARQPTAWQPCRLAKSQGVPTMAIIVNVVGSHDCA
ncbi:MAG: hypothetical protein ACLT76_03755 [Clostridium fessum]